MGRNNQQRRAAKRRERARREAFRRGSSSPGRPTGWSFGGQDGEQAFGVEDDAQAFRVGVDDHGTGGWGAPRRDEDAYARHEANQILKGLIARVRAVDRSAFVRQLVETSVLSLADRSREILDEQLTLRMIALLANLWENGWQPADLLHVASRIGGPHAATAAALVVEQSRRTSAEERAPAAWLSQLTAAQTQAAEAGMAAAGQRNRLVGAQLRAGIRLAEAWVTLLQLAVHLESLPSLGALVDPPSAWGRARPAARPTPTDSDRGKVMAKIRALLAKAEATNYPAEAEALTAKAQDLMTRHAIDEALLHAHDEAPVDVVGVRVHLQAPYVGEKVALLNQVAVANRTKTVWHEAVAMATMVGTPVDVDQAELLFTSLLIQATRAMAEAGATRPGTFDRSASFRRSFLASYGVRIGERLAEASAAATFAYGQELVPVLARQTAAVDQEYERLFPRTYQRASGVRYSQRGWQAGRDAADRATFVAGQIAAS